MLNIGNMNRLTVAKHVDFGVYLTSDQNEILLPKKYVPEDTEVGMELDVFIYTDSEDRLIATTLQPKAIVGQFVALQVKDATSIGAFLDWGLEKDLFVPRQLQKDPMVRKQLYVVYVCLDEVSQRVIASSRLKNFFDRDTKQLKPGQKVNLLMHENSDLGIGAVIDGKYSGLLYHNEVFETLSVGDRREGYVKEVRDDGKVDLSLQPQGYNALMGTQNVVLKALAQHDGYLPLTSKSDPEDIYSEFGMSKKAFKKLIGGLYRERKIVISDDGIRLAE